MATIQHVTRKTAQQHKRTWYNMPARTKTERLTVRQHSHTVSQIILQHIPEHNNKHQVKRHV